MKNYNVLIDGYNLRLTRGSGIKNYTISLIEVLEEELNVSLLFDYKLNEPYDVFFTENYYKGQNLNAKLSKLALLRSKISVLKSLMSEKPIKFINDNETFKLDHENNYLSHKEIINIRNIFAREGLSRLFDDYNITIENTGVDIFHSTYPLNIKVNNTKRITTIHDLIPLKLPHTTLDNTKIFFNKIKNALKISDKIVTISEYSRNDILENFDVPEEKVVNCYQSYYLPDIFLKNKLSIKSLDLNPMEYFLFVGNIEPKKNVGRLIEAFLNIDTNKKLVIVGRKAWLWEELLKGAENAIAQGKIILLNYVSRENLIALYQNAFAFVFPSLYEGFGLPPLESMACSCPVITSNLTSLPEVCGDAAIYCDPYSVLSIQNALEKMLNLNSDEREVLIKNGLERVKFFNKQDYKNRVLNVYESVL